MDPVPPPVLRKEWRSRLHEVIFEAETPAGRAFDVALLVAIVLSVTAVCLESVASVRAVAGAELRAAEWVFTVGFSIEYVLRLLSVRRPMLYARSFFGIVDLLAVLPTYLSLVIAGSQSLLVIRALRLLRVFRVFAVLTFYGIRLARAAFGEVERGTIALPGFETDWAAPTYRIVRFLILVFAVIVAFPYLPGSGSPAFKGISLFLGLLISLGSSSAIANVIAGAILTYTKAFRIGDRVKIAATEGYVLEKTLLATRVRTTKNVEITVPNSLVLSSHIVNYSVAARGEGLVLHTAVTIGYDVPWRKVHALLLDAAARTEGIVAEPQPFVLQLSLDDYYPTYELNVFTRDPAHLARLYSDLHANVQDAFNEAGVEIMSPAYCALRDGNRTTIPASYRPPGYRTPGFRVEAAGDGPDGG